jgi:hypothetical protein
MDLIAVLQDLGVPYREGGHEHCRGGWVQVDCPWCTPQAQHWRLGLNLAHLYASCWSCGGRPLIKALALASGRPYKAVESLLGTVDRPLTRQEKRPRGRLVVPEGVGPLLPAHEHYLRGRGFDPGQLAQLWGVRGIGVATRLAWRLWVPFVLHGKAVSWTTRKVSEKSGAPRYVSASPDEEEVDHKRLLLGEDFCRHAVVVCEGPLDAMRVGPGAVAVCGTAYSRAQVNRLAEYPVRAVCFDSEPAAQARAKRLCDELGVYPGRTVRVELDAEDPASAPESEILALRKAFLPYLS